MYRYSMATADGIGRFLVLGIPLAGSLLVVGSVLGWALPAVGMMPWF